MSAHKNIEIIDKNDKPRLTKEELAKLLAPENLWNRDYNTIIFDIYDITTDIELAYEIYYNDYYVVKTYTDGDIAIKNSNRSVMWISDDSSISNLFWVVQN